MAATATFVLISEGNEELGRYTTKGSANRAAKKVDGAEVVPVAQWDAEQAVTPTDAEEREQDALVAPGGAGAVAAGPAPAAGPSAEAPAEEKTDLLTALRTAVPATGTVAEPAQAKAPRAPKGPTPADVRLDELKATARKLTIAERRALALRIHAAVREALDALEADADAGRLAGGPLADVTSADLEVQAGNWMWHVPQGGATWGQNR